MEFRLMVKSSPTSHHATAILLENQYWYLSDPLHFGVSTIPQFAAISYRWGLGRLPHPFHDEHQMSDQTYYALSAAIKTSNYTAFWIDALCIPVVQPARSATLGAMGFIYGIAEEVVVSFPPNKAVILKELQTLDRLTDEALMDLENDEWVKSIWTYDEVVNSQKLKFVSDCHVVEGLDFLDFVGFSLNLYQKAHHLSSFDIRQELPHLDAFVELIGDWQTAAFTERSAFQVMSNLDQRFCLDAENYFYAMIASITAEIVPIEQAPAISVESLAETMMKICESKKDFSFIFSTSQRDERSGKEWRPLPVVIHSVLSWHSIGDAQTGYWDRDGFWFSAMVLLKPLPELGESGKDFIDRWLKENALLTVHEGSFMSSVHSIILKMGFSGCGEGIPTSHGFFYPHIKCFDTDEGFELLISTQIWWTFGAPGLAKVTRLGKVKYFPGVFVGLVDKGSASDVIIVKNDVN